jgi:hypothetical protein
MALDAGSLTMGVAQSAFSLPPPGTVGEIVTAGLGEGQDVAAPLAYDFNNIVFQSAANDGVLLPASVPGVSLVAFNSTAVNLMCYAQGTDTVGGNPGDAGKTLAAGKGYLMVCVAPGVWASFAQA